MSQVDITLKITLDDSEFVQVGEHIYTTYESLTREEPTIHFIGNKCLNILKQFEGRLTLKVIKEWQLLSRALDQTCSYSNRWNDEKIIEELINGEEHPVSWYVHNCCVA
ncbi:hypothetical protein [Labilibacter marinus]|uniref:hypothetical protein n=1 Tax=Labilibacter marinus TaxID=1477105 RepID=UPI0008304CA5|nr:hypothetical protein [Labilibacter marinus]